MRLYLDVTRERPADGRVVVDGFRFLHFQAVRSAVGERAIAAAYTASDSVLINGGSSRAAARRSYVTSDFFRVLGVTSARGRFFTPGEDAVDRYSPVAVISRSLWERVFNDTPDIVGKPIQINGERLTIIGVVASGFRGIDPAAVDIWVPLNTFEQPLGGTAPPWYMRANHTLRVLLTPVGDRAIATLRDRATAAVRGVRLVGVNVDSTTNVLTGPLPAAAGPMVPRPEVGITVRVLVAAGIVLIGALSNVLVLMLVRVISRERETSVRRALGASNARIVTGLLLESLLLSAAGATLGSVLAFWVATLLRALLLPRIQWASGVLDGRLLGLIGATSVAIGLVAGAAAAYAAIRPRIGDKTRAASGIGGSAAATGVLLVAQATFATILLVGAGLFTRSLENVKAIDLGYDAENVTMILPLFSKPGSHDADMSAGMPAVASRAAALDGVIAVGYAAVAPMQGLSYEPLFLPDRDSLPPFDGDPEHTVRAVSPGYFAAAGTLLREGREFTASDVNGAERVVIVAAAMAKALWPGERPLGKCLIRLARSEPCSRVIGVVADAHRLDIIERPVMQYYVPIAQTKFVPEDLIVRTRPGRAIFVRRQIEAMFGVQFPDFDGVYARRIADVVAPQLRVWHIGTMLFGAFGVFALLVAGIGIYSTVSYSVRRRMPEFAIRRALGAQSADIVNAALRRGVALVGLGVVIGIGAASVLGHVIQALLFGLTPSDPGVIAATIAVMTCGALLATFHPARRAIRSDPADALKAE